MAPSDIHVLRVVCTEVFFFCQLILTIERVQWAVTRRVSKPEPHQIQLDDKVNEILLSSIVFIESQSDTRLHLPLRKSWRFQTIHAFDAPPYALRGNRNAPPMSDNCLIWLGHRNKLWNPSISFLSPNRCFNENLLQVSLD